MTVDDKGAARDSLRSRRSGRLWEGSEQGKKEVALRSGRKRLIERPPLFPLDGRLSWITHVAIGTLRRYFLILSLQEYSSWQKAGTKLFDQRCAGASYLCSPDSWPGFCRNRSAAAHQGMTSGRCPRRFGLGYRRETGSAQLTTRLP